MGFVENVKNFDSETGTGIAASQPASERFVIVICEI